MTTTNSSNKKRLSTSQKGIRRCVSLCTNENSNNGSSGRCALSEPNCSGNKNTEVSSNEDAQMKEHTNRNTLTNHKSRTTSLESSNRKGRKRPRSLSSGNPPPRLTVSAPRLSSANMFDKPVLLSPHEQDTHCGSSAVEDSLKGATQIHEQHEQQLAPIKCSDEKITSSAATSKTLLPKQQISLSLPISMSVGNDINLAYTRIPSSPVRSVVSCDADISSDNDVDMHEGGCHCAAEKEFQNQSQDHTETDSRNKAHTVVCNSSAIEGISSNIAQDLQIHIRALTIEATLAPMKPLLYRLISHQSYNRKGTFSVPVDPIALGLKDYSTIIKEPMDLGTIKQKLLANVYTNQADVARDIRLVFKNACLYNPPLHPIHEAARHLLDYFEDAYALILSKSAPVVTEQVSSIPIPTLAVPAGATHNRQPLLRPAKHTCKSCLGRTCIICKEGCLSLEPSLLICAGAGCSGSKIRRGVHYYCSADGTKSWCHKCFANLPAVLPSEDRDEITNDTESGNESDSDPMYKRDLLKRRNEEDVVERWIQCTKCNKGVHQVCAFVNEFSTNRDNFVCPLCSDTSVPLQALEKNGKCSDHNDRDHKFVCTFLSGKEQPEMIEDFISGTYFDSRELPNCEISRFIEAKVKQRILVYDDANGAEKTVTVRVISDHEKDFTVPDVVQRHFRMKRSEPNDPLSVPGVHDFVEPPATVPYRSKAIALFQRIDGMDVCIFCMFVQEYNEEKRDPSFAQQKRVYVAYIDSVEHFRPRQLRTAIYQEILAAYLATARARGFETAHIWSCPPSRGNSFVFWAHPGSQRTPSKERLLSWYHNAVSLAVDRGVVTDVSSLYEYAFQDFDKSKDKENRATESVSSAKKDSFEETVIVCPPLLEGDFWIEEAARVHSASISRWFKSKKPVEKGDLEGGGLSFCPREAFSCDHSKCPCLHVATLIEDYIMKHPLSPPFHRPVNAAALKLKDYHQIIKKPMDLGTILMQCLLGEYDTFLQVTTDLELVFKNAMMYNPKGHPIHLMAKQLWDYSQMQLNVLARYWDDIGIDSATPPDPKMNENIASFCRYGNMNIQLTTHITMLNSNANYSENVPSPLCSTPTADANNNAAKINAKMEERSNLLFAGPEGIAKLMVGDDVWLLDKKHNQKDTQKKKKKKNGKKKCAENDAFHGDKKRRQSWLGDEVLATVRRLRTDFFVCRLPPKDALTAKENCKKQDFLAYIEDFEFSTNLTPQPVINKAGTKPGVADTRHGLLEFSQYGNLQFDTVRRAKYSTAMLLSYLRGAETSGIIPKCSACNDDISNVRWHRVNKSFDERRRSSQSMSIRMTCVDMSREELCECCHGKTTKKDDFVPIRVSFRRTN